MKRLLCGSVVLAVSLTLASCSSDPTGDFQGDPARIVADPSSIFLDQGATKTVNVRLEDDAGDPLAGDWEIATTGSGITVERNPNFLGTTTGAPLESEAQFVVTAGDSPVPTSFTLTAGGLSLEIPVKVTPVNIAAATFSNPAPAVNEAVTVTAEGYTFLPDAAISFGGTPALVLGVAEDGSSMTFLPAPGTTGTALIDNVSINFLPGTPLSLETTQELTVAALVPLAGTDAPGTAPALVVPEVGATSTLYDGGTFDFPAPIFGGAFGEFPARLYSFTVPADGDYTVSLDWAGGVQDMGVYYFLPDGTTETGSAADAGGEGAHPEESTSTFTAGTYLMAVINFSATNPEYFSIQFTREPPAE
jgi:hypothetical protein